MSIAFLRRASHDERACATFTGALLGDNAREMHGRALQVRGGLSAMLDMACAYSARHIVEPRAASVQNRQAKIDPMGDVEPPFTSASATLLPTHSTHVRFK